MYVSPAKKEIKGSTHERRRQIEIFSGKLNLTGGGGVDFRQGPIYNVYVLYNTRMATLFITFISPSMRIMATLPITEQHCIEEH